MYPKTTYPKCNKDTRQPNNPSNNPGSEFHSAFVEHTLVVAVVGNNPVVEVGILVVAAAGSLRIPVVVVLLVDSHHNPVAGSHLGHLGHHTLYLGREHCMRVALEERIRYWIWHLVHSDLGPSWVEHR